MRRLFLFLWLVAARAGDLSPVECSAVSAVATGRLSTQVLSRLRDLKALNGQNVRLQTKDGRIVEGRLLGPVKASAEGPYVQVHSGLLLQRVKLGGLTSVEGVAAQGSPKVNYPLGRGLVSKDLLDPLSARHSESLPEPSAVRSNTSAWSPTYKVPQPIDLAFVPANKGSLPSVYGRAKNYVPKKTPTHDAMDSNMSLFIGDLHLMRGGASTGFENAELLETTLNHVGKNRDSLKQVVITGDVVDAPSLFKLSKELGLTKPEQQARLLQKLQADFYERLTKALLGLDHTQEGSLQSLVDSGSVSIQQLEAARNRIKIVAGNHDLWRNSEYQDVWPKGKISPLGTFALESVPPEGQKLIDYLKSKKAPTPDETALLEGIQRNFEGNKPVFLSTDFRQRLARGGDIGKIKVTDVRLNTVYDQNISTAMLANMNQYGQVVSRRPTDSSSVSLMTGPDGHEYYALLAHEPLFKGENINRGLPEFNQGLTPEGHTAIANAFHVLMVGADKHSPNAFRVPRGNVMNRGGNAPDFYYAMNGTLEGGLDESRFQRGGMLLFKPRPPNVGSKRPEFELFQVFFDAEGNMLEQRVDPAAEPKTRYSSRKQESAKENDAP